MYTIIDIKSGIASEQFDAKRLKVKPEDFDKFRLIGYNVVVTENTPIVEPEKVEEIPTYIEDNSNVEIATTPDYSTYSEDVPSAETVAEEPSKIPGIIDFNLNEVTNPAQVVTTPKEEEKVVSITNHPAWNNPGYTQQAVPSIATGNAVPFKQPAVETPTASSTTTSVVEKATAAPKQSDAKTAEYYIDLRKNKDSKLGPTASKVLDSETPELDKLIKLLEKLHSQLAELKAKKEELHQRKQEVLEGKASIDELLGKTMTLDLTAIQARAKALNGAEDVIDNLRKSVEQIKEVGIASEDTVKKIEKDIKTVEEDIVKTQEDIGSVQEEKTVKCAKIAEDLKTATSIDEKEELVTKQLEILRKQKEALTGTLPKANPFDSMRTEEDEPIKARAA